MQVAESRSN